MFQANVTGQYCNEVDENLWEILQAINLISCWFDQ